jgi:hypothetical protein
MAYDGVFGLSKTLKEGGETEMLVTAETSFDKTTDAGKLMTAEMRRNAVAMVNLMMTFTMDSTMALVYKDMDSDWPSGLAHKVAKELKSKYQPQDIMTHVELHQMLNKVSIKKSDSNPSIFEQISLIKN